MSLRLYDNDSYLVDFRAKIASLTEAGDSVEVTLDRTAFYPTSGGQPCDLGSIGRVPVVDVVERGREIIHVTSSREGLEPGEEVLCRIDYTRRFDHMQQHLGQHLLSAAFERTLDAPTVGFHLGSDSVTIDLAIPSLDERQADAAEDLANVISTENRRVFTMMTTAEEAAKLPLRKAPTREGPLRIVVVQDFDYSPCGGTHPRNTGEVGIVKITGWERVRSGIRVSFLCGGRALRDYRWKNATINSIARRLSVAPSEALAAVERQAGNALSLAKEIERLSGEALDRESEQLVQEQMACVPGDTPVIVARSFTGRSLDEIKGLAARISSSPGRVALLASHTDGGVKAVFARSEDVEEDMNVLMKVIVATFDGKGGGTQSVAQGGVKPADAETAERIVALAAQSLRSRP